MRSTSIRIIAVLVLMFGHCAAESLRVVWAGRMPGDTTEEKLEMVKLVRDVGFDALVVRNPAPEVIDAAHDADMLLIETVVPYTSRSYAREHPGQVQAMLPLEEELAQKWRADSWAKRTGGSYRWHPVFHDRPFLCFDDEEAREILKQRVSDALSRADGVFLDGFGYRNMYACFSLNSMRRRVTLKQRQPGKSDSEVMAIAGEEALVEISEMLYDHAKAINPDAIVMNHVWPPYQPKETYAHRLKLDYCSQTISWFYPPVWHLERVRFEASEHKRLEDPERNRFMPFIGMRTTYPRSAERTRKELEIAHEFGDGSLVWGDLRVLNDLPEVRETVKEQLKVWREKM